ncbi:hypothetical protein O9G_004181 [Rozella allomycis CSF55]|uniref:Uncharacterized protein n=1 Tax=Rozella allomycis (strain CSF55) TaxID=988480 RepID=A0A075AXZ0_ROZAC|nr:hypothetical protein O9G_004181 [Rozella allomycis CSF55]|eukprot:EPZ35170.1 hypothetical protein O9G_004181 [Rozella allomycis CSF55]
MYGILRLYEGTLQTAIKIDALINLYTNMFFKNIYLPWIKPILMLAIRNKALLAPVYTLSKIAINFTCYLGSYLESAGNIISPTWTIYIKRIFDQILYKFQVYYEKCENSFDLLLK